MAEREPRRAEVLVRVAHALVVAALAASQIAVTNDVLAQTTENDATSIWGGVFTDAQAERGRLAYTGPCDRCHGSNLDGAAVDPDMLPAPPVAGPKFLRKWNGRSLAALFEYTRATMPTSNPGFLTDQEFIDIIAYMLAVSGAPAGEIELTADGFALAQIAP
jgi:mono/diheme cytochrome c family protein